MAQAMQFFLSAVVAVASAANRAAETTAELLGVKVR